MDVLAEAIKKIIAGQEQIIGPIAIEQAQRVSGLEVDWEHQSVKVTGQESSVLTELVGHYQDLFGQASVEVCKEAAASLLARLPAQQVPALLR